MIDRDEPNMFVSHKYHQRSTERIKQLWIYESLLRTYKKMFSQPVPKTPPPQLIYVDEEGKEVFDVIDYTWQDVVNFDAEKGCHICFQHVTVQNYNPIMYCEICISGVHARCYGENLGEDIDEPYTCHYCANKKGYFEQAKKLHKAQLDLKSAKQQAERDNRKWAGSTEQKVHEISVKKNTEKCDAKKAEIKAIKCYLCGLKNGFMKKDNPKSLQTKGIWWHPLCVMASSNFVLQDIDLMKSLKDLR